MTARARITQAALARAAKVANATGTVIVIEARDGTVYRIAREGLPIKDDDGFEAWRAKRAPSANTRPV